MKSKSLKGVNLGGWLVVEKWISPSLFEGLDAVDEYTLCLSDEGRKRLKNHRKNFITAEDFEWLKEHRVDSIRIPVGYWLFEDDWPYMNTKRNFDFAISQAEQKGVKVLIDLHGAPGSQNGNDHSGRRGGINWPRRSNKRKLLGVLERIAKVYGSLPCVIGIEVMNEPDWIIGKRKLKNFYKKAYKTIRKNTNVDVIVSDTFKPREWMNVLPQQRYPGLVFDLHLYQVFSEEDRNLTLQGHLDKAQNEWLELIKEFQRYNKVIVGEWSIELQPKPEQFLKDDNSCGQYARAQLSSFSEADAWYFWTLKTEDRRYWSFKDCVKANLIEPGEQR